MQEPAEFRPPSAAVKAAVFSAPVLTLISLALLGLTRYKIDPNGGIFAIIAALIARLRTGFADANVKPAQDPERKKKGAFISQAKLFDCLWISQFPVAIVGLVLSQYGYWSLALAFGIHRTLLQVS
jgi:hypothetical protein